MLRRYEVGGLQFWFEEGQQPEGAVLLDVRPKAKPKAPSKRRTAQNKAREADNK